MRDKYKRKRDKAFEFLKSRGITQPKGLYNNDMLNTQPPVITARVPMRLVKASRSNS